MVMLGFFLVIYKGLLLPSVFIQEILTPTISKHSTSLPSSLYPTSSLQFTPLLLPPTLYPYPSKLDKSFLDYSLKFLFWPIQQLFSSGKTLF